jgi:hypothetical protein
VREQRELHVAERRRHHPYVGSVRVLFDVWFRRHDVCFLGCGLIDRLDGSQRFEQLGWCQPV